MGTARARARDITSAEGYILEDNMKWKNEILKARLSDVRNDYKRAVSRVPVMTTASCTITLTLQDLVSNTKDGDTKCARALLDEEATLI